MADKPLGRLEKVDLRSVWTSESGQFTPWLARPENLALLGETIGLDLTLEAQEKSVGPFRADILCRESETDHWVLIENQLERTDHTHLGQLLTYAAGLNAVTVVWVASAICDEHRAALDWLNEHTDASINLFGLEIELWRIGDSPVAPKFNIISRPNDWLRSAAEGAGSEHGNLQLRFWTGYCRYMDAVGSTVRRPKPASRHWMTHRIGRSGVQFASIISLDDSETNARGPEIRAELELKGPHSKAVFAALFAQKEAIEAELGGELIWRSKESVVMCRIYTRLKSDFRDEARWPEQFAWLREQQEALHRVFVPRLSAVPAEGE